MHFGESPLKRPQRAFTCHVSPSEFADTLMQQLGKHRITIMLDDAVVRANKACAGGRGYQTLINKTLRRGLEADAAKDDLREVVRQVIREELRAV